MTDARNTDRAQLAELSLNAKAFLVTVETMKKMVEALTAERDALAARLERVERRERVARFKRKRGK